MYYGRWSKFRKQRHGRHVQACQSNSRSTIGRGEQTMQDHVENVTGPMISTIGWRIRYPFNSIVALFIQLFGKRYLTTSLELLLEKGKQLLAWTKLNSTRLDSTRMLTFCLLWEWWRHVMKQRWNGWHASQMVLIERCFVIGATPYYCTTR